jgi:amino acid permease
MLPTLLGVLAVATPLSFLVTVLTFSPLGLASGLAVGLVAALPILVVVRAERRRREPGTVSR